MSTPIPPPTAAQIELVERNIKACDETADAKNVLHARKGKANR